MSTFHPSSVNPSITSTSNENDNDNDNNNDNEKDNDNHRPLDLNQLTHINLQHQQQPQQLAHHHQFTISPNQLQNHRQTTTTNPTSLNRSELETDRIKEALLNLSSDTRRSLLMILLDNQPNNPSTHSYQHQHQHQHHPLLSQHQQPQPQPHHQTHPPSINSSHPRLYQHQHQSQSQSPRTTHNYPSNPNVWNDLNLFIPTFHPNQQQQQQPSIHSKLSSPILPDQASKHPFLLTHPESSISHEITPVLSPSMTPLSTFSSNSYSSSTTISDSLSSHNNSVGQTFQASNPQLEFFSPLTSPALRPLGYHDSSSINNQLSSNLHSSLSPTMPALIDQAAALGLSNHQSFAPTDRLSSTILSSSTPDLNNLPLQLTSQQTYLPQVASSLFPSPSNLITHPPSVAHPNKLSVDDPGSHHSESINQSPILLPHHLSSNTPTSSPTQTKQNGRPRPVRSGKSRPSPLIRAVDQALETNADRPGPVKRPRSQTGVSLSKSPGLPAGLSTISLADSPSPIDMPSKELNALSSFSSSGLQNSTTAHPIGSQTPLNVPPSQQQPASGLTASNQTNAWNIQPMTPASLFNFESPLSIKNTSVGNVHVNLRSNNDGLACGMLKSVDETHEGVERSESSTSDQQVPDQLVSVPQPRLINVEERRNFLVDQIDATLSGSDSKQKDPVTNPSSAKDRVKMTKNCKQRTSNTSTIHPKVTNHCNYSNNEEEGPELRKSSHKVAEQRRRDSLKMCFEDLRQILPPIPRSQLDKDDHPQDRRPGEGNVGGQRSMNAFDPSNPNKGMSKVALLRRSNEYILRLRERLERRDGAIEMLVKILEDHHHGSFLSSSYQLSRNSSHGNSEPNHTGSKSRKGSKELSTTSGKNRDETVDVSNSSSQDYHQLSGHRNIHSSNNLNDPRHQFTNKDSTNLKILSDLKSILHRIGLEKQEDKEDHHHHLLDQNHDSHHLNNSLNQLGSSSDD